MKRSTVTYSMLVLCNKWMYIYVKVNIYDTQNVSVNTGTHLEEHMKNWVQWDLTFYCRSCTI